MAKDVQLTDNLLTGGQNEGIERSVLPLPQLSSIQNARMRKASRWGKRFGSSYLSQTTVNVRCAGGARESGFVVDGDSCSNWDQVTGAFISPVNTGNPSVLVNPRVMGAASGWLPDTSYFPVPARAMQNQTTTPCACTYAFGYLWTAIQFIDPVGGVDFIIRVTATNTSDQTLFFLQDITTSVVGSGGVTLPKLVRAGTRLLLVYLQNNGATSPVMGQYLDSGNITGGFSTATPLFAGFVYQGIDASTYSSTEILVAGRRAGNADYGRFLAATLGASVSTSTALAGIVSVSIVGSASTAIYLGFGTAANTFVRVMSAALAPIGTATVSAFTGARPLMVETSGGVRVVHEENASTAGLYALFSVRDVSSAGVVGTKMYQQAALYPMSMPFSVAGSIYLWCKTSTGASYGYATLIRLIDPATLDNGALFATGGAVFRCPLEMSVQDYTVSTGPSSFEPNLDGLPTVPRIGTTAAHAFLCPTQIAPPSTVVTQGHDYRVLQATHWSLLATEQRSINAVYADSSTFIPMGALTRVDDRGAVEEGFVSVPALQTLTPNAGGALTASSTYYYCAVFKSRGTNGRYEVSGVSAPVSGTLNAAQHGFNVGCAPLTPSARPASIVEFYRTLANGQTFYLCAVLDASIATSVSTLDLLSDAAISTQAPLYTQIGQTLPNAFPPPSRFGVSGGSRLFLGGLIRGDIVQASKLILGDQSPTFADNDAFRIVLPGKCTGLAWMDALVMFTADGIYIASGEGPDDSGVGDFGTLTRMPYQIGCIEPRSVLTVDDGTFFQTSRGLYMLPRGFGAPAPVDEVSDTLATYPVITGCATLSKASEQTAHWTCSGVGTGTGARLVYDLAHKVWSVDYLNSSGSSTAAPIVAGQWIGGEVCFAMSDGLHVTNSAFSDRGGSSPIAMALTTADVRSFGANGYGSLHRVALLAEVRSACSLGTQIVSDWDTTLTPPTATRVFTGSAPDWPIGQNAYVQIDLGSYQLQATSAVRVTLTESSTSEGLAFIALGFETGENQGMRLTQIADRIV